MQYYSACRVHLVLIAFGGNRSALYISWICILSLGRTNADFFRGKMWRASWHCMCKLTLYQSLYTPFVRRTLVDGTQLLFGDCAQRAGCESSSPCLLLLSPAKGGRQDRFRKEAKGDSCISCDF